MLAANVKDKIKYIYRYGIFTKSVHLLMHVNLLFICRFERQLKAKLQQKATVFNTEEATLIKAFKYFDLNNDGTKHSLFLYMVNNRYLLARGVFKSD